MNTAQIYAGGGTYATPPPPTVENQAQTSTRLHEHQQKLFELLDQFACEDSLSNQVQTLLDATFDQLNYQIGAEFERTTETRRTYTLYEKDLGDLYSGMRLAYYVAAIRERWDIIQQEREVRRG